MKNGWLRGGCFGSFVLLAFVVLAGCGGGGDDGGGGAAVTYSISGQVTSENGSGLSGVTMALSGASSATTITDANGNYTFTGLDNGSYTITPSRTGFTFSPTSSPQTVSGANKTAVNFILRRYKRSLQHLWPSNVDRAIPGLSGVTMTLTGASSATTITDASGNYTFTGLDNGRYTITPGRTGYTFSPTSSQQTVSGADKTAVNFTATAVQAVTYSISGQVTLTGIWIIRRYHGIERSKLCNDHNRCQRQLHLHRP